MRWTLAIAVSATLVFLAVVLAWQLPSVAARALLHPARTEIYRATPVGCEDRSFRGHGVTLQGWICHSAAPRRATVVYLHGIADNRASGTGVAVRFVPRGFDVLAYDSRAHGRSGGGACTYGYFEKRDLQRVIAALEPGPVVLIGASLGAAVALQAAVDEPRVVAVVAAEVFADLHAIVRDRLPFFVPEWVAREAFRLAEKEARFDAASVSPAAAAAALKVPVLLVHGAADRDTPAEHSRRVYAALRGPKRLIVVDGAGHNQSLLGPAVWREIDTWVEAATAPAVAHGPGASRVVSAQ